MREKQPSAQPQTMPERTLTSHRSPLHDETNANVVKAMSCCAPTYTGPVAPAIGLPYHWLWMPDAYCHYAPSQAFADLILIDIILHFHHGRQQGLQPGPR